MYHQKRPRMEQGGPGGDQDWTCPSCGNINFAFRSSCNMRKCGAPKPEALEGPPGAGMGVGGAPPPMGVGVLDQHGHLHGLHSHSQGPGVLVAHSPGPLPTHMSPAPVGYGGHSGAFLASPGPVPMQHLGSASVMYDPQQPPPQHLSYLGPSGVLSSGYGSLPQAPGPVMDPYMQRSPGMQGMIPYGAPTLPPMGAGPPMGSPMAGDGRKRRGGPDGGGPVPGGDPGDWVCPSCGNMNFAFRTHCNMRKCGEPKPPVPSMGYPGAGMGQPPLHGPGASPQGGRRGGGGPPSGPAPPEGSWTCRACGNVNYPFRTHCNRRNCGVKRGATSADGPAGGAEGSANGNGTAPDGQEGSKPAS